MLDPSSKSTSNHHNFQNSGNFHGTCSSTSCVESRGSIDKFIALRFENPNIHNNLSPFHELVADTSNDDKPLRKIQQVLLIHSATRALLSDTITTRSTIKPFYYYNAKF